MTTSLGEDDTIVLPDGASEGDSSGDERRYLLVVDAGGTHRVRLPGAGQVCIGRAPNAEVRLADESASRRHAMLELRSGSAQITDLGSQNGTRVGGEPLEGARVLRAGDIIAIGTSTLVFQCRHEDAATQDALEYGDFMRRAGQEVERSLRYQRSITIAAIRIAGTVQRAAIEVALARGIRAIDVFSWSSPEEVLVLMPELDADDAFDVIGRLLRSISPLAPQGVRGGFATGPTDAEEVTGLLEAARAGTLTSTASAGDVIGTTFRTFVLGERTIVVADAAMLGIYRMAERLAATELPVLIGGETGTGKELVASAIHVWSPRRKKPFVAVNCATFTEALVESELFGHEKGAFTGAVATHQGVFERAQGGTVFLDEVGELSPHTQAALLRVLETRTVRRVGGSGELPVDFRLVSATNRDIARAASGQFRQDLFYRLGAAVVRLPPLRERRRELRVLAQALLEAACRASSIPPKILSPSATELCSRYSWPGNVRELKHAMDYLAATVDESVLEPRHLEPVLDQEELARTRTGPEDVVGDVTGDGFRPLYEEIAELEKQRIRAALEAANGNQTRAAALLAMPLRTFQAKVKQYALSPRKR